MSNDRHLPPWATRTTLLLAVLLGVAFFLPWLTVSLDLSLTGGSTAKFGKLSGWGLTTGRLSSVQLPEPDKEVEPDDPPALKVLKQPDRYVSARPWYALALLLPLALLLLGALGGRGRLSPRSWANAMVAAGLLGANLCLLAASVVIASDQPSPPGGLALFRLSTHTSALLWCCVAGHVLVATVGIWTRLALRRSPQARPAPPRRITTARVLLTTVGTASLLLVSLLAYARWIMDPETFAIRKGSSSPAERERASLRWHRGSEPCLRNRVNGATVSAESHAAARDLMQSGFGDDITPLIGVFARWQAQHEAAHHRHDTAEEHVRNLTQHVGVLDRMILWLARDRIVDSIRRTVNRSRAGAFRQSRAWLARLAPERRRALRALWKRHPRQLSMPGFIHVHRAVSVTVTHRRADALVKRLVAHAKRTGSLPEDLDETIRDLKSDKDSMAEHKLLSDGWMRTFEYKQTPTGARITSYGADHKPGGDGLNADIVRQVTVPTTGNATELQPSD